MHPGFLWRMAWRDSRSSRRRLLVFSISITLGIAALVSIGSFRSSLSQAIEDQTRTLVGADLIVSSSRAFRPEDEALLRSLGAAQAREVRFSTMAVFPKGGGTRLVSARALGGDFPFYGPMETDPPSAAQDFRQGGSAVVDESLLIQFGAKPGDTIKIGEVEFKIAGALKKVPGEASAAGSLSPRVYLPLQDLARTELLKPGSIARYRNYVKFPAGEDVEKRMAILGPQIQTPRDGLRHGRVAEEGSRGGAGKSLPLSQSRRLHRAAARRGRRGERDPGASATEASHGGDPALSRRVGAEHGDRLSAASGGDGIDRRDGGRGAGRGDAAHLSR